MVQFEKECGLRLIKELTSSDNTLSRIYGFILYTEQNPYVSMVLRNPFFWDSLDSISGPRWPIFAVRPLYQGQYVMSHSDGNNIGFMVQTWNEPEANNIILEDFGLSNSEELPLFVAFMWDDKDQLNQISIPIIGNNADEVYHSLEEIVKAIARAESAVLPQYKGTVNVFRNIVTEIKALKFKHTIIYRGKIIKRILEFLGSIV